ncbi:MAG: hypothetical protein IKR84_06380 [Oscillibacter sp.]|nr:hypothetical protein [Oscillibacter sp.]
MTERVKCMRELYGMLMEELSGAEAYSELACGHKAKNPELAKKFDPIAADELKHAGIIEAEIANIVKASGAESEETTIYDFMSDAISDAWTRAKSMQSRYKGV